MRKKMFLTLIPSLALIVCCITVLICSSVAFSWFSSNSTVEEEEATIKTYVPINVMISEDLSSTDFTDTITLEDVNAYNFKTSVLINADYPLYPVSYNGKTFRYATTINPDGTATTPGGTKKKFEEIDNDFKDFYYISKDFYVITTSPEDVYLYVRDASMLAGTSGDLYKAIRICVSCGDTQLIIRHSSDMGNDPNKFPVDTTSTTLDEEIAVRNIDLTDETYKIILPASKSGESGIEYTPVLVNIKIWIEGQNENAVVSYAGTSFYVELGFGAKLKGPEIYSSGTPNE